MQAVTASIASTARPIRTSPPGRVAVLCVVLALASSIVGAPSAGAVVGGTEVTDLTRWEFIVKVGGSDPGDAGCGGTLIHPRWVLTAAHCAGDVTHVHFGALSDADLAPVMVDAVHSYPRSWDSVDLALVRLSSDITSVAPAPLGTVTPVAGASVHVAGWGATNENGSWTPGAAMLREGTTTVRDESDYPSSDDTMTYMIWAGGEPGDADACYGDSGGPLIDATGALVGVVSRGVHWASTPCGEGGLYADVTSPYARNWIEQIAPEVVANGDAEPPNVTDVVATPDVVPVGAAVVVTAAADDTATGGSVIATASAMIGDVAPTPLDADDGAFDAVSETVTATLVPQEAGVLEVCVTATDADGNTSEPVCASIAVYDPDAGFAAGRGVVQSPASAHLDGGAAGPAEFVFVSRYAKGRTTPVGTLGFVFRDGDLQFRSTDQSWLVVTGEPRARFQGVGLLNDTVACQYVVDAWDGSHSTGGDAFGLRLFDCQGANPSPYHLEPQPLQRGDVTVNRGPERLDS